jgi:GAF domain-containing protein
MANPMDHLGAAAGQQIDAILQRLTQSEDVNSYLQQILDVAITMTGADMGTLQRFDDKNDCLRIVASRGFSNEALRFFGTVRRDTNTSCAAALTRRMHVFVGDIPTSYLYVGTPELDMMRAIGVAAAQSTPFISSSGRLWGVITAYFREPQLEDDFNRAQLDRLSVQVADSLEQRGRLASSQQFAGKSPSMCRWTNS